MIVDFDCEKGICHPENTGACSSFIEMNKWKIVGFICTFITLGIGIAIYIVASNSKTVSTGNPCEKYTSDSLASSVTTECLAFIWKNANCKPVASFPAWWTSSPQGGKTIACNPYAPNEPCGAGSFIAIVNNMSLCKIDYNGH